MSQTPPVPGRTNLRELSPVLAAICQRHSIGISAIALVLYGASTALTSAGGLFTHITNGRMVVLGVLAFVLAGLLGVLREWSQRRMDAAQREAATALNLAVRDALKPLADSIAGMPMMTPGQRRNELQKVAQQATGAMFLLLRVDGLRVVVYGLTTPDRMDQIAYQGRAGSPGSFIRHAGGEPDEAFEALERAESRMVHDIEEAKTLGQRSHGIEHSYRTYISVPIVVGDEGYGMLTLDAPEPNSFTQTELYICEFVASMLATAFAIAQDNSRS